MNLMINISRTYRPVLFLVMITFLFYGCTVKYPQRFAAIGEIYPPSTLETLPADIPPDTFKKGVFEAPLEEVFQAVTTAVSQAKFNIEKEDQARGLVLANRSLFIPNAVGSAGGSARRLYSYAFLLKEIGPESTEVTIMAKLQDSCHRFSGGFWTMISIISLGIAAPTALIAVPTEARKCRKASTVRWAADQENSLQEMGQLLTFTRNNLIAAGVL